MFNRFFTKLKNNNNKKNPSGNYKFGAVIAATFENIHIFFR